MKNKLLLSIELEHYAPFLGIVALLIIWQLAFMIANTPEILPSPNETIMTAIQLFREGYWKDLWTTLLRALAGVVIALLFGIPLGLILGNSDFLYKAFHAPLAFMRSIPAFIIILIPIAIGLSGEWARIITISLAGFFIMTDECAVSVATIPQDRIDLINTYGGNRWHILSKVIFFESLGRTILPSAKTIIGISFIVTIVVESFSVPQYGVGARLLTIMSSEINMTKVYSFILMIGTLGLFLNQIAGKAAKRIIYWKV